MKLRRVAIALIALQFIGLSNSYGATTKPKPKITTVKKTPVAKKKIPTVKSSATPKKKTRAPKVKVSATAKSTTSKKPASKKRIATTKKKVVVHRYIYHKPVRKPVPPSPSPQWPPKTFASFGTTYARVPTGAELIGILSAMKNPPAAINTCSVDPKHPSTPAYSCAAVLVASSQKCIWWKITSTITGPDPANSTNTIPYGDITTYVQGAAAKTIQTVFLVSPVPLQTGVKFTGIHALCGMVSTTDKVPSTSFIPVPTESPTPSETPSETPTESPTPSPTSSN